MPNIDRREFLKLLGKAAVVGATIGTVERMQAWANAKDKAARDLGIETKQKEWKDAGVKTFVYNPETGKADIEVKEAAFYGSEWWKNNVDYVRSHLAHREVELINLQPSP